MNRSLKISALIVSALTISVAGTACNSSNSPAKASQTAEGPAWSLHYQTSCGANTDATGCVGAYGLTVNADGTYQVGPGPQGQIVNGKLDAEDFSALSEASAGAIDGTAVLSAESCNGYYGNVADYTLTLIKHSHKSEVLHKSGDSLCSSHLAADAAESLHYELINLADKYYPTPFPDECLDAAAAVEALYPTVSQCHVDADCGYLDPEFAPIPAATIDQVFVDNCSVVRTLPAANLSAVHDSQAKLQGALEHAQQVCGARIARDDCAGAKSFASSAAPAVCQQGECRINPSLGF